MWCSACQQDVPGVAVSVGDSALSCARCGGIFETVAGPGCAEAAESGEPSGDDSDRSPDFFDLEDWELDAVIRDAERMVRQWRSTTIGSHGNRETADRRPAAVAASESRCERADPDRSNLGVPPSPESADRSTTSVPWLWYTAGLALFVCGSTLAGWSLLGGRPNLWQVGLPLLLGGQMGILAGLIRQLESVWMSNRAAFRIVHALDERLRRFGRATGSSELLHRRNERAYFRHGAEHVEPHAELSELQTRLDAVRVDLDRVLNRS